ncbi:GDP-mannose 4,6-dehydratase [Paenochrobactrum pullorum]|uniref:GDP-mannose 4,6-dehydratase n=1 Tax=Paenochrobactrum pullorum TaxID=1324351 RepID=UPI0035BC087F
MSKHRILITGASGFVGQYLQKELQTRALEDDIALFPSSHMNSNELSADITDYAQVLSLIHHCQPTAIIHLAAIAAPQIAQANYRLAFDVNVAGTINIAQAILNLSPETKLIHAGSSECYGRSFMDMSATGIEESAPLQPQNIYSTTKMAADILLQQLHHQGLRAVRFRPFNHTGAGQADLYVASAFAKQIAAITLKQQQPVIKVGNLEPKRDFLDVRDIVRAYADAAISDDNSLNGEAYNLSTGRPIQIQTILQELIHFCPERVEISVDKTRWREADIHIVSGNPQKVKKTLNWQAEINLSETLSHLYEDWLRILRSRPL